MSDDVAATEDGMKNMAGHNASARRTIIREVMQALDGIESEIRELQEKRKKIKNVRIKGDLGMKVSDFAVLRRFRALEEDDRAQLFETLREGFRALGIGAQASFLEALDEDQPAPGETVDHSQDNPKTKFDAENFGYLAGRAGHGPDVMPVMRAKAGLQKAWLAGNERGLAEIRNQTHFTARGDFEDTLETEARFR